MRVVVRRTLTLARGKAAEVETRDLVVPALERRIPCRLYGAPDLGPDAPLLVFAHGGGFFLCDVETHDEMCRLLAREAACRILSVDYTLAPEADVETQLQELVSVFRWAVDNHADLGVDGRRLALGGDSAGGWLAMRAARRLNASATAVVQALLLLYPLTQTTDADWVRPRIADFRFVGRVACAVIQTVLKTPTASLFDEPPGPPLPVIIVTGRMDPTTGDARRLADALSAQGAAVELQAHRFLPHGSLNLTAIAPFAARAVEQAGRSLARLWSPAP